MKCLAIAHQFDAHMFTAEWLNESHFRGGVEERVRMQILNNAASEASK